MVSGHEDRNQLTAADSELVRCGPQWCPAMKTGISLSVTASVTSVNAPQWCPAMKTGISSAPYNIETEFACLNGVRP